jgi:hypothetical protein
MKASTEKNQGLLQKLSRTLSGISLFFRDIQEEISIAAIQNDIAKLQGIYNEIGEQKFLNY